MKDDSDPDLFLFILPPSSFILCCCHRSQAAHERVLQHRQLVLVVLHIVEQPEEQARGDGVAVTRIGPSMASWIWSRVIRGMRNSPSLTASANPIQR